MYLTATRGTQYYTLLILAIWWPSFRHCAKWLGGIWMKVLQKVMAYCEEASKSTLLLS